MIVELVEFVHPAGASRADVMEGARATLAHWRADAQLLRKHYLLGTDGRSGAGIYFWPSIEAAQRAHSPEWLAAIERRTGHAVRIRHYELLMTLDNPTGLVDEAGARLSATAPTATQFTGKTP